MIKWLKGLLKRKEIRTELPPFIVQEVHHHELSETIDWGLSSLGIPELWKETQGEGVKIAILDTGAPLRHPDLTGAIIKMRDFTGSGVEDKHSHQTHCSGIALARKNKLGVVGVAPKADLIVGKVLNDDGSGRIEWIVSGMEWALESGADIISMSLGAAQGTKKLEKAVKNVIKNNCILIVAAGNSGQGEDTVSYPGHYPGVITVGSINRKHKRSDFSSTGATLDIMAPGEDILSCIVPDGYGRYSGTSMSCPFVAGLAALILSKHRKHGGRTPCENQEQMLEHLTKVATDIENPGFDKNTGWGIVNPKRVLVKMIRDEVIAQIRKICATGTASHHDRRLLMNQFKYLTGEELQYMNDVLEGESADSDYYYHYNLQLVRTKKHISMKRFEM